MPFADLAAAPAHPRLKVPNDALSCLYFSSFLFLSFIPFISFPFLVLSFLSSPAARGSPHADGALLLLPPPAAEDRNRNVNNSGKVAQTTDFKCKESFPPLLTNM